MGNQIKALLIGDNENAKFHPLERVKEEIVSILKDQVELVCSDSYQDLGYEELSQYQIFIVYADQWKRISDEQMAGFMRYASMGGRLLVIHNGISFQERYEYAQMIGAIFLKHPPYQNLHFHVVDPKHPIMMDIEDFQMEEEPYRYVLDPFQQRTILLEYEMDGIKYPAAWTQGYGLGKIVYLMPGHNQKSFQNPAFRKLVQNSVDYLHKT